MDNYDVREVNGKKIILTERKERKYIQCTYTKWTNGGKRYRSEWKVWFYRMELINKGRKAKQWKQTKKKIKGFEKSMNWCHLDSCACLWK